jgi:hypothetical protein
MIGHLVSLNSIASFSPGLPDELSSAPRGNMKARHLSAKEKAEEGASLLRRMATASKQSS